MHNHLALLSTLALSNFTGNVIKN